MFKPTLWILILSVLSSVILAEPTVVLKQGVIRGHLLTSRKGRDIFAFQGIPYVKPPVGALRFQPPQTAEPWKGILNATQNPPVCVQKGIYTNKGELIGQEDCLYLNVYTPQLPPAEYKGCNKYQLRNVLVWIHDGGWYCNNGNTELFGPQYLLDRNVILVTFNYRLGALGFLSTGDKICPGNNGLKDQVAALRWVQDNIAQFGGNSKSVTIFGQSAGGASVHYHMLYPISKGLFHRAISQSGTAACLWSLSPKDLVQSKSKALAAMLSCPTEPSSDLISCLKEKDAYDIIGKAKAFIALDNITEGHFIPVVETDIFAEDETFISEEPLQILHSNKNITLVPWLVGMNSQEGGFFAAGIFSNNTALQQFSQNFNQVLPIMLYYGYTAKPSDVNNITKQITNMYFNNQPITEDSINATAELLTDGVMRYGINLAVKEHIKRNATVYFYEFAYRGTNSYASTVGYEGNLGVVHDDELQYLFPEHDFLFPTSNVTAMDEKMVDILTNLWTNFGHTGNPTPSENDVGIWHPASSPDTPECAVINNDGVHMEKGLHEDAVEFWESLPLRNQIQ